MSDVPPRARLRFHSVIAIVLVAFIVAGFTRTFYLRFLFDLPPMRTVLHLHGVAFTAWLALFIAQTRLVAANRVDLHMRLGVAGALLALIVVVTSLAAMLVSAATPRVTQLGITAAQGSIIPLMSTAQFAVLVTAAIALRRRAGLHKRLMVLAVISAASPAVARLTALLGWREHFLLVQMSVIAAFVTVCLVHDWRRNRIVHPVYAVGGVVLVSMWPARYAIARSETWQPIAEWIAGLGKPLVQ